MTSSYGRFTLEGSALQLFKLGDDTAAKADIALIDNSGLSRRDIALWLVKAHLHNTVGADFNRGWLRLGAVTNLDMAAKGF